MRVLSCNEPLKSTIKVPVATPVDVFIGNIPRISDEVGALDK